VKPRGSARLDLVESLKRAAPGQVCEAMVRGSGVTGEAQTGVRMGAAVVSAGLRHVSRNAARPGE